MTVGERIRNRRKQLKLSVDQLAAKLNKNRATVYRYESNDIDNMPLTVLEPLAKALGVTPAYLMGWESEELSKNTSEYPYIPISISAGLPLSVDSICQDDIDTISLPDSVMGKWSGSNGIFIMRVNGESMNNIIPHYSLIAVKPISVQNLNDGDIVVYSDGDSYAVKRFYKDDTNERLIFRPDSKNDKFTDYIVPFSEAGNIKIHGKVVVYIVEMN